MTSEMHTHKIVSFHAGHNESERIVTLTPKVHYLATTTGSCDALPWQRRCGLMDMASAYGAKSPGFESQLRLRNYNLEHSPRTSECNRSAFDFARDQAI